MKIRYEIRTLLVVCGLVAIFFPFQIAYDNWFRSSYSGYHVHKTLRDFVSDGDSFEHVSSLFDFVEPRSKALVDEYGPFLANGKSIFADHKNGDEYYVFSIRRCKSRALFQFRNRRVVNHANGLYQVSFSQVQQYDDRSPNPLLRHGALPVYSLAIVSCGLVLWLAVKFTRQEKQTA